MGWDRDYVMYVLNEDTVPVLSQGKSLLSYYHQYILAGDLKSLRN